MKMLDVWNLFNTSPPPQKRERERESLIWCYNYICLPSNVFLKIKFGNMTT